MQTNTNKKTRIFNNFFNSRQHPTQKKKKKKSNPTEIKKLSQVALPRVLLEKKKQIKLFCCTVIPSLHISGQQSPDLATALLCQGCHTPVAHHRQALPPQDRCWNVLLKDQPYHFLSPLPCKGASTRLTFPQQTESRHKSPQKSTLQEEDRRPGSYHFALSS